MTRGLGRQTELEVADQLRREVEADRFARLDQMLIAQQEAANAFADLRPDHDTLETMKLNRALLISRARRLEKMSLATEVQPGEWHISDRAEATLRTLGEREDIIKSMHRALEGNELNDARGIAQLAVHRDTLRERITGRVLARDLAGDGNGDRVQLVIDGTDGRVHQIELRADRCDGIGRGMIVAALPPATEPRAADRNIRAATGSDGTYHPSRHIEIARDEKITPDPERFVAAHVRRLEALRRAGIVERWSEDHWNVPQDLPQRGLAHDRKGHGPGARMELLSPIGLDRQVTHDGATWLDKELMRRGGRDVREEGFGLEMKRAMERRKQVLVQRGDAQDLGRGRIHAPRDLVQCLEAREIDRVGRVMAAERDRAWSLSASPLVSFASKVQNAALCTDSCEAEQSCRPKRLVISSRDGRR